MCMKFFVLFFFFIPFFSLGYVDERRDFGDNDNNSNRVLLEESISQLTEGFGLLIYLASRNYPPAQKFLGLINQDFKKAKNSLKEYNEKKLTPVQPPTGHSRSLFQQIRDAWFNELIPSKKEADAFLFSGHFLQAFHNLTEGFYLLDILNQRDYEPAKEFQSNFENRMAYVMEEFGIPVYLLSEELNQKCKMVFDNYFAPER